MPVLIDGYDPLATLIPSPDTPYAELAEAHWHLAQAAALDMQRLAAELLALRERHDQGFAWCARHEDDRDKTKWGEGMNLLIAIGDDIHTVELELSQATRTCWDACRNSWVAARMAQKVPISSYEGVKGSRRV